MRVNRPFLYAGVFLVAIGGVLVAANVDAIGTAALADVLRLWPLAVIALGLGVVLRRSQVGLASGLLAAALPGLLLGSALGMAPRFAGDCGARGEPVSVASEHGSFVGGSATITVTAECGTVTVGTAPGTGWQFRAGNSSGRAPNVGSSARSLSIGPVRPDEWLDGGRDAWDLTLPTTDIDDLSLVIHAGKGRIDLPGAQIGRLALTANASAIVVDTSSASVAELSGVVNVGSMSISLPADSDLVGSLRVRGGRLEVCLPPDVGLHLTTRGQPRQVTVHGLRETGSDWQSPGYTSAARTAELDVHVNFGTVEIDPIGGCQS
jgi:hypothetical protein